MSGEAARRAYPLDDGYIKTNTLDERLREAYDRGVRESQESERGSGIVAEQLRVQGEADGLLVSDDQSHVFFRGRVYRLEPEHVHAEQPHDHEFEDCCVICGKRWHEI